MSKVLSVEAGINEKGNTCRSTGGGEEERSIDNVRKRLEAQSAGSSVAYTGSQLRVSGLSQRCFESTSRDNVQMMYGKAARCSES